MRRVPLLLAMTGCLLVVRTAWASGPDFHLQVVPATVYKVDDPGNSKTSSFVFNIAVICSTDCALTPISASVELLSGSTVVERQDWTAEMLAKIKEVNYRILPDTSIADPSRVFTLPEAFDLHFYFRELQVLAIDSAEVRVKVADAKGRQAEQTLKFPVQYYQQKTKLIVPFHGLGVVGQDWVTNGGHNGGSWNAFALDLRGLDDNYAEEKNNAGENASEVGWGREIIAPAAGTVIYARNDIPDNARPGKPPELSWYTAFKDPIMANFGNWVMIDHGNSEYSVLAHMQQGSVVVKAGDQVAAGQVIGKLGSSGSSSGPHVHYQLQTGPQLFHDQTVPFKFEGADEVLSRGMHVNEK
jgi:hypothetical protein